MSNAEGSWPLTRFSKILAPLCYITGRAASVTKRRHERERSDHVVRINLQLGFNDVEQADANVGIPPHGQEATDVLVLSAAAGNFAH